jgi:hypothetical protein
MTEFPRDGAGVLGGGGSTGKQVDMGERDETCGVNNETVQSDVGSTRDHTCSGCLLECNRSGEVMCEICVACITCVFCTMCVCATKLLFCREKGIVLVIPSGMAQFGSTDQSRWNINCGVTNMSSRSSSCRNVHGIRIPCRRAYSDMCCFFVKISCRNVRSGCIPCLRVGYDMCCKKFKPL